MKRISGFFYPHTHKVQAKRAKDQIHTLLLATDRADTA